MISNQPSEYSCGLDPPPTKDDRRSSQHINKIRQMANSTSLAGDILFCVPSADVWLASARYRALLPAAALRRRGLVANVVEARRANAYVATHRAIVLSKAFRPEDLGVAHEARRLGKPLYLDLCDNVFLPAYGHNKGPLFAEVFMLMARWAQAIVVTGEAMGDVARMHAGDKIPIEIIPDQLETRADIVGLLLNPPTPAAPSFAPTRSFKRHGPTALSDQARAFLGAPSPSTPERRRARKTLLWFGNHGAAHGLYGIKTLEPLLSELRQLDRDIPISLLVMSNNRAAFDRHIAGSGLHSAYVNWSPLRIYDALARASLCLLPNSGDEFSRAKSANRAVLALGASVPVVANDFPALAPLRSCIAFDGWRRGALDYLQDEARRARDLERAAAIIETTYSANVIAQQWAKLVDTA
jgi:glycosyltransferase involved in cell wall biosynthesis